MQFFSASYTDRIKFNQKPNEDFYLVSSRYPIFSIADGVTQSRFPSGEYAFPTGARAAAQIFCYTTCEFLEKKFSPPSEEKIPNLISESFDLTNFRIKQLNKNEGIDEKLDYLGYDWFDTVGAVGIISKNLLYYGYVGDCGLAIFNSKDDLRIQTRDMVSPVKERASKSYPNWDQLNPDQKAKIMRKEFRNRLDGKGYGSFTGEEGVKKYYQINKLELNPKDLIVFYSDGFFDYLQIPEFIEILRNQDKKSLYEFTWKLARSDPYKYGTDRTLIAVIYENSNG